MTKIIFMNRFFKTNRCRPLLENNCFGLIVRVKYVTNKNLETHVLKKGEDLEILRRISSRIKRSRAYQSRSSKELRFEAWLNTCKSCYCKCIKNPERMWVHLGADHKHALQNYKSKGFEVFKEEEIDFVA